jgi:sulfide:quinone oxidoreductase
MKIVVLGAGFGGLTVASELAGRHGEAVDIVLIDRASNFVFGFSKLDVMFGRATEGHVEHPIKDAAHHGVRVVKATVLEIDPVKRNVVTDAGNFDADILVIALGAEVDPAATPGLAEDGNEFYSVAGAFAARDAINNFGGGHVVVGVTSTPFKCPPAPSETALLMHEHLVTQGLRDSSQITLVMPFGTPIPPSPQASAALLSAFKERGIEFHPESAVQELDPERHIAKLSDGTELAYDLFLGIPVHRAPSVVIDSGLTEDGWIPVDPLTLETKFPHVYAIGDVTSVGTPKAGVFAEGQAEVVANRISAQIDGTKSENTYNGNGICYLEFGGNEVAKVDVTFLSGQTPSGELFGPSPDFMQDKVQFGAQRIRRWFNREWATLGD